MVEPTPHTDKVRHRYDRLAFFYDFMEAPVEWLRFGTWRGRLRSKISGPQVLEAGVGTGKNMSYYPPGVDITAIDFSPSMLEKARKRAEALNLAVNLLEMDIEHLAFPDDTFDTIFATFVFCSVPDPVQGLQELRRVVKPGGRLLLLEHMRPGNRILALAFDAFNPLVSRMVGANINRRTVENIRKAGWTIEVEGHLSSDIVRWIEASPGK